MCIISSLAINWQFRLIDHNSSHKPVYVLSPGMPENGVMVGQERRCLFITVSWVISWLIKIDLKHTYC